MAHKKLYNDPTLALKHSMPALAIVAAKARMEMLLEEALQLRDVCVQAMGELGLSVTIPPVAKPATVLNALRSISKQTKKRKKARKSVKKVAKIKATHASKPHHKGKHWTQKPENKAKVMKNVRRMQKARLGR